VDILGGGTSCVANLSHWLGKVGSHEKRLGKVSKVITMLRCSQLYCQHFERLVIMLLLFAEKRKNFLGRRKNQKDFSEDQGTFVICSLNLCPVQSSTFYNKSN
jgi:hypothetical protein